MEGQTAKLGIKNKEPIIRNLRKILSGFDYIRKELPEEENSIIKIIRTPFKRGAFFL